MKAVIIANEKSLWRLCEKSILEELVEKLRKENFEEIYVYPARYKNYLKKANIKFLRSLKYIKGKAFVIKSNVFIKSLKLEGDVFKGNDGEVIAYIGRPSKNFKEKGKVKKIDGFEIKNEDDLKKAEKELIDELGSSGLVSKYINKKISSGLASLICKTYITPLQLYITSFLISLLAFLFYIPAKYVFTALAGICIFVSLIVEETSNKISYRKRGKEKIAMNIFSDFVIVLGAAYLAWSNGGNIYAWIFGFLVAMGITFIEFIATPSPVGRDFFMFAIFIGSIFNQIFITLAILAIIINAEAIKRVLGK
jgi:hypothetical protein